MNGFCKDNKNNNHSILSHFIGNIPAMLSGLFSTGLYNLWSFEVIHTHCVRVAFDDELISLEHLFRVEEVRVDHLSRLLHLLVQLLLIRLSIDRFVQLNGT